jgi:hypothetical protein
MKQDRIDGNSILHLRRSLLCFHTVDLPVHRLARNRLTTHVHTSPDRESRLISETRHSVSSRS